MQNAGSGYLEKFSNNESRALISILNWNGAEKTIECLNSLQKHHPNLNEYATINVIDNGSSAHDASAVEDYCKINKIEYKRNTVNLGFAGGHNTTLQKSLTENYLCSILINNDCIFIENTITPLMEALKADINVGAASPQLAYEDSKEIYFSGAYQNWNTLSSIWSPKPNNNDFWTTNKKTIWAVGTVWALRCTAIQKVGLLDDELFAYCEDDDYGERLIRAGFRTTIIPNPVVLHGNQPKTEELRPPYFYYLTTRNHVRFYLKYTPKSHRKLLHLRLLLQYEHRSHLIKIKGGSRESHAVKSGYQDAISNHFGHPRPDNKLMIKFILLFQLAKLINTLHHIVKQK